MNTSDSLRSLADWVAAFEDAGYAVGEVGPIDDSLVAEDGAAATMTVELPGAVDVGTVAGVELTPTEATITEDGTVQLGVDLRIDADAARPNDSTGSATDPTVPAEADPAGTNPDDDEQTGDGQGNDDAGTDDAPADEPDVDAESADTAESVRTESETSSEPAYRDPDRLREVYHEDRTFEEMRDALGVDVTPQTVRKYMVEHGIHQPASQTRSLRNLDPESIDAALADDDRETATDATASTAEPSSGTAATDDATGSATTAESERSGSDGETARSSPPTDASADAPDASTDAPDASADADPTDDRSNADPDSRLPEPCEGQDEAAVDPESTDPDGGDVESASDYDDATTDGTSQFEDLETIATLPEDLDLPDRLTVVDVVEAIETGQTFHDVKQTLGLDRTTTRALLSELDLLDLIHGRLSTRGPNRPSTTEIEERIRNANVSTPQT